MRLKQELADAAMMLEAKARMQRIEASQQRMSTPSDYRAEKNELEKRRKVALQRRNNEALFLQMQEKRKQAELIELARLQEHEQLEANRRLYELEQEQARYQSLARVSEYRSALDLQRQVKLVTVNSGQLPASPKLPQDLNQLVFEFPEFQNPVFTYQHPKPVMTDPITFNPARSPRLRDRSESDLQVVGKEERFKKGGKGKISEYGQMSLRRSPFQEPVHDKHSGVLYRDTRGLIR